MRPGRCHSPGCPIRVVAAAEVRGGRSTAVASRRPWPPPCGWCFHPGSYRGVCRSVHVTRRRVPSKRSPRPAGKGLAVCAGPIPAGDLLVGLREQTGGVRGTPARRRPGHFLARRKQVAGDPQLQPLPRLGPCGAAHGFGCQIASACGAEGRGVRACDSAGVRRRTRPFPLKRTTGPATWAGVLRCARR